MTISRFAVVMALLTAVSPAWATVGAKPAPGRLHVAVYAAKEANVNAFVFYDATGSLIVDATKTSQDAHRLALLVRSLAPDPEIILLTHGHPDHYFGIGTLKKEFPRARILVASQEIKDDLIRFTRFMDSKHGLENEPSIKPRSDANPLGFDYEKVIEVLVGNRILMPGGAVLEVSSEFRATEAAHETLLYSKELNAVFTSDLAYNRVHLWMGAGVNRDAARNWKTELDRLSARFAPLKIDVYPGHGPRTDAGIFAVDGKYIDDLLAAVKASKSQEEAKSRIVKRYPRWLGSDFILSQSIKFQTGELSNNERHY